MIDKIEKYKCTGCKMCGDVCHNNAIYYEEDKEGFWYPKIKNELCDNCGECINKCPSLHPEKNMQMKDMNVYAAWSKSSYIRDKSTSGGIFWEIAKEFINNGGCVAGTKWDETWKSASFCIVDDIKSLERLRGSKYVQSDTNGIYNIVKKLILENRKILFCGTPCQVAAMQTFLGKKIDNIYYLDFICRNINSPKAFKAYICDMEKRQKSYIKYVRQKSKKRGWNRLATNLIFENGDELILDRKEDYWINGFVENDLFTRECCFECQYRKLPRLCADITVGDFWGIDDVSTYDLYKGVSVVIVNSLRGQALLKNAKSNIFIENREIEQVLDGNKALLKNPINNVKRTIFFENLDKEGFIRSVDKALGTISKTEFSPEQWFEIDRKKYFNNGDIDKNLYIYLNFECSNVCRKGTAKIIPYQNVIIDLKFDSRIILEGDMDFHIGSDIVKGSKVETLFRMGRNARVILHNGGDLTYGTTIDIKDNAIFEAGFFSANTGSVFVIRKKIYLGEDVMMGRNIIIYDSDFHQIIDKNGEQENGAKEVIIEDHVWLTSNVNVHKGAHIGEGSVIANQTIIGSYVPKYSLVGNERSLDIIKSDIRWKRNSDKLYLKEFEDRKIILYGFGVEGKKFYKKYKEKIGFVIDNNEKLEVAISFEEFTKHAEEIQRRSNEWLGVIAAPNYYDELYYQLKTLVESLTIVPYHQI